MSTYGTAYVPANGTTVTLVDCVTCGNVLADTPIALKQHEMTDTHKLAVAAGERKTR